MAFLDDLAQTLGGAKKTPEGYLCRCPCHDDKTASLSLAVNDKGLIVNCFAGCDWKTIKEELIRRGLIKERPKATSTGYSPNGPSPTIQNLPAKTSPSHNKYKDAIFYEYKDLVGNLLCRKVKLPNKRMWFERPEGNLWIPNLNGISVPLYNIQAVVAGDPIYLCEGEKDAETLIQKGLCATTNHSGALGWAEQFTESLKGKTVVIIPDNDKAGKERLAKLSKKLHTAVKELRVFVPDGVPQKGDITDWVENGGDVNQILPLSKLIEKKKPQKLAEREDYYELFERVLESPRRCIFNEKLMHKPEASSLWNPAINSLQVIRSEAAVENVKREAEGLGKFQPSLIEPHFFAFEASKTAEFLVDIPEWDGQDRIELMASLCTLNKDAGVSNYAFGKLLKEWCSLVFKRLHDPMIQNRILVLKGPQGIGKDTWTSMLVDGLGQFSIPLAIVKEDKDTYLNLHRGLIMKISEFDKTAKTEVSTLKDIITAPSTNLRAPYDKDSKVRFSRCSFISSANADNLLRDSTGNRRFLIFEIDHIDYVYESWSLTEIHTWQMQCLAQMVDLAKSNYKASPETWAQMNEYIERQTPQDISDEMLEQFLEKVRKSNEFYGDVMELSPSEQRVSDLFMALARETGVRYRAIKSMIQQKIGTYKRSGNKRYWVLSLPKKSEEPYKQIQSGENYYEEKIPF